MTFITHILDWRRRAAERLRLLAALLLVFSGHAWAETIWFAPPDDLPRGEHVLGADFADLFKENPSWTKSASRIQVFELNARYTFASSEADLTRVIAFLREHKIQLALDVQAIERPNHCGYNVEGHTPANGVANIIKRFKKLGADVKYIVMDEPLFFGHQFKGPNACHFDINSLVKALAPSIKVISEAYPDARIGQTEPVSPGQPPEWLAEVGQYLDAFKRETGKPISFIQADISWRAPGWQPKLAKLRDMLKGRGVEFGMIFNASEPQPSNEAWIASAIQNIETYNAALHVPPDQAVFASWTPHPSHLLPETSAGSLTYLVNRYVDRWNTIQKK